MRIGVSVLLSLLVLSLAAHGAQREEDGGLEGETFSNSWAVEVDGGDEVAELIAEKHGFTNLGQVSAGMGTCHVYYNYQWPIDGGIVLSLELVLLSR